MGFSLLSHFQIWPARVVCFVLNAVDDVFIKCLVWYWVLVTVFSSVLTTTLEIGIIVSMYQKKRNLDGER